AEDSASTISASYFYPRLIKIRDKNQTSPLFLTSARNIIPQNAASFKKVAYLWQLAVMLAF
uniref:hypothetical protein n=1 Tax=Enterocloster clostridioformis TaxID=1531 RepID=UPI00266F0300